jgi:predicted O-methyltransferase YrrM
VPDLTELLGLYETYRSDLAAVQREQARFYAAHCYSKWQTEMPWRLLTAPLRRIDRRERIHPQLDDLEAEITYLLIRSHRPETVVEFSPNGGWSSTWILRALEDNDRGKLFSYDLIETSTRHVPGELRHRWEFFEGDVQQAELPDPDYLFIDSDHSGDFARWYTADLLSSVRPGTPVSVHDIFHQADPMQSMEEPRVIVEWLDEHAIPWFTVSPLAAPSAYASILAARRRLGLGRRIHYSDVNPMLFFTR